MRKRKKQGGLVWSSSRGRMCPGCDRPVAECACEAEAAAPPAEGPVRVSRETKGRKGKGVTVVTGLPLAPAELAALARELKRTCGSGGTARAGTIEVQGDHRESVARELERRGYAVRVV